MINRVPYANKRLAFFLRYTRQLAKKTLTEHRNQYEYRFQTSRPLMSLRSFNSVLCSLVLWIHHTDFH